ncbi:hypothetical protein GJAV_G00195510 [Gymnothorax javanicus]|nr:hypothetical protein GJAV_G00195510 [Gymnothorax javanicus]
MQQILVTGVAQGKMQKKGKTLLQFSRGIPQAVGRPAGFSLETIRDPVMTTQLSVKGLSVTRLSLRGTQSNRLVCTAFANFKLKRSSVK